MDSSDPLIRRCAEAIRKAYGPRLAGIVLYGSVARGDDGPESDVDLLVLLDEEYGVFDEIERLVDILYPLELESCRLICAFPARASEYRRGATQLYRNAIEEGVPL